MKGQVALEFFAYIMLSLIVFGSIVFVASTQVQSLQQNEQIVIMQDFSAALRYQLTYLASMPIGTSLTIELPNRIADKYSYEITTFATYTLVTIEEEEYIIPTPIVQGSFAKGQNLINVQANNLVITNG